MGPELKTDTYTKSEEVPGVLGGTIAYSGLLSIENIAVHK